LSLKNSANSSTIMGYSATGDVARGGRKTAFLMDEAAAFHINDGFGAWASTQHVTNCRAMVSTPKGMAGVFAEQMRKTDAAMVKVSLHWSQHPEKQRGLYTSVDGVLHVLDDQHKFVADYPFVVDGKLRSPWYDRECQRHPIPALIAQELDIDYGGSGFPFFNANTLDSHAREYGMEPSLVGDLDFTTETYEPSWRTNPRGRLRLWLPLTADEEPSHSTDYVIGCDIATGVGGEKSSNSVASIVDRETGEKVAEYVASDLAPHEFADRVIALRRFFHGPSGEAFVGWEANGAGGQFGKHFTSRSAGRIYFRENESLMTGKKTKTPGWWSNKDAKRILLGEYAKALESRRFINHSKAALEEALHYVYLPTGAIEHDRAQATLDPTAAGENHGDRVIADAIAWRLIRDQPAYTQASQATSAPYGSMAWRLAVAEREHRNALDRW
jgi:hypothetical protein